MRLDGRPGERRRLAGGRCRASCDVEEDTRSHQHRAVTGSPSADAAIRKTYVKPSGNAGFDQTIQTYYDVVGSGKSLGASPAGQAIQSELNNAITSALLGQKTPEQALADAQAAAQRAYDKVAG